MRYATKPRRVRYYWVIDGVPVAMKSGPLSGGPPHPDSCCHTDIYISAQGMQTDLSGFKLVSEGTRLKRLTNRALSKIASKPPLLFIEQLCKQKKDIPTLSCVRIVLGQMNNIVGQAVLSGTHEAHLRSAEIKSWELYLERELGKHGGRRPPKEFWKKLTDFQSPT